MNTSIVLVFAILIALAIGFYIGKLLLKTQSNAEKSNLEGQLTSQSDQLAELKEKTNPKDTAAAATILLPWLLSSR